MLGTASTARHMQEAASLGETKLNDLVMSGETLAPTASGDFSPEHPSYQWKYETQSRDYNQTEVAMRVSWMERGQEKSLVVATLINLPATGAL
jgi:hypothetical protein